MCTVHVCTCVYMCVHVCVCPCEQVRDRGKERARGWEASCVYRCVCLRVACRPKASFRILSEFVAVAASEGQLVRTDEEIEEDRLSFSRAKSIKTGKAFKTDLEGVRGRSRHQMR